jgi:type II secretory pathway predicted ATPase ExeA
MATYLKFYSLKKLPFDLRPGTGPVLATRPVRDALAWVQSQLADDHGVLCVSGAAGVGRTSLSRALPGALAATSHVARIADPTLPWEDLNRAIATQLCFPSLSRGSLVEARTLGQRVTLVIDTAERAPAEVLDHLDALLYLRGPVRERLIQVVLLARAERELAPEHPFWPWLELRRPVVRELDPISPDEIHGYIRKRLESAGRLCDSLFTESASLVVHRHSRGVPRQVNHVCDAVLREALRRCARRIDGGLVDDALAATT